MNLRYLGARDNIKAKRLAESPFKTQILCDFWHDIQVDMKRYLYEPKEFAIMVKLQRDIDRTLNRYGNFIEGTTELLAGYKIRLRFSEIHDIVWHTTEITLGE